MPSFHNSSSTHINSHFLCTKLRCKFSRQPHLATRIAARNDTQALCNYFTVLYLKKEMAPAQHVAHHQITNFLSFHSNQLDSLKIHLRHNNNNSLWLILLSLISPLWPMMETSHDLQVIKDTCAGSVRDRWTDRRDAGGE